jgi:hypothetical protein
VSADRAKYQQEISLLEQVLQDVRTENAMLLAKRTPHPDLFEDALQRTVDTSRAENSMVSTSLFVCYKSHNFVRQLRDKILLLEKKVLELTQLLENRTNEAEGSRKKLNRDASVLNGGLESSKSNSSKPELSTVREEVAGLKSGSQMQHMFCAHTDSVHCQ